jgi:hypothetical protein
MPRYGNTDRRSSIWSYEINDNEIVVGFVSGDVYTYSALSVGAANFQEMKRLAIQGKGLNEFINKRVKRLYTDKKLF